MTELLVNGVLDPEDLRGLAETVKDHANSLEVIWRSAGLLGPAVCDAQSTALSFARALANLADSVDQHKKDAKLVKA